MRTNFLLQVILISCLVTGCCDVCAPGLYPDPGTAGQPTPNPFEPTPTKISFPIPLTNKNGGGAAVAWSPSGKWIVIPTNDGVKIYNADTLNESMTIKRGQAFQLAGFGMTDTVVVMVDMNLMVTSYDLALGEDLERRDSVQIAQISNLCPEGKFEAYPEHILLVCLDKKGPARLDRARQAFFKENLLLEQQPEWVSADGSLWAIAHNTGHVVADVYNIPKGAKFRQFRTIEEVVKTPTPDFSIAISTDGELVAVGDFAYNITVWNTRTQMIVYDCKGYFPIKHMSFSPNNHKLALIDDYHHAVLDLTGSGCTILPDKAG
jgi:WD40 repeat protein